MNKKILLSSLYRKAATVLVIVMIGLLPFVGIAQNAPSNFSYSVSNGVAYKKLPQNSVCPSVNNGGAAVTFSLVNPPSGITISPTSGQISWDATVGVGKYVLTATATNSVGSTTANYTLNVMLNPDDFMSAKYTSVTTSNLTYTGAQSTANSANQVDVYTPSGDTNTHRPVFMFMHGGGFSTSNDKTQSYVVSFCKFLATYGYVAYGPNYNVGGGHTLPQNLKSCKDMDACLNSIRRKQINYPAGNFAIDSNYLFVGGGSAGGHLSCNFVFADNSTNYGGFMPNLNNVISEIDGWGSSPTTDRLYNFSSLNANSMPTFIVQGSADQTVPVQYSIDLNNALNTAGAYHNFWEITGETHGCPNHIPAICDSIVHFQNRAWKRKYPQTVNAVCVVTPVKLNFFGVSQTDKNIAVKWNTATEENVNFFAVERSMDGINFSIVYTVNSKGNGAHEYSYNDDATVLAGIVYYRLKSVDNNGAYAYSEIENINIKATKNIVTDIFPNPAYAAENINIKYIATKTGVVNYQILNTIGQKLITSSFTANEGNNKVTLNLNNLKCGLYYLVLLNNNAVSQRLPFIVK